MAEKFGIDIEFRGKTVELDNNLNYINKNIKTLKKDIRELNKDLKLELNASSLNKGLESLSYAIAESQKGAKLLEKSISEIRFPNEMFKDSDIKGYNQALEKAQSEFNGLQAELDATNTRTKELQKQYEEFQHKLNHLDTYKSIESLKNLKTELRNVGEVFTNFGNAFRGVSALSLGGLGAAFNEAKNFESAFTGVMKTVDETATTTYADIEKSIRNMAKTLPSSTTEIANVMEIAGQLGVKADDLNKFTKVIIDLGNATNIVGQEGATQLAQFYNVMGGNLNTIDRFGAALTHLGNNSATTEADILSMGQNLAAIGKSVHLTEQEVLALATSLTSVGISAEKGGSAISNILLKIDNYVGTGSDKLQAWADVLGMTTTQFSKLWNEDSLKAIQLVIKALGTAEDSGGKLSAILDELGVNNIRQIDTITRLANSYQNFDTYLELSNEAWDKNTALVVEANRRYSTTESQIQIMKNNLSELAITIGKNILPVINDILKSVKPIIKSFTDWAGANSGLVTSMLLIGSSLSPVLSGIGRFATTSSTLVTSLIRMKEAAVDTTPALQGLAGFIGGATKFGLVGAAIAATTALGYLVIKYAETQQTAYQATQTFKDSANALREQSLAADEAYGRQALQIEQLKTNSQDYATQLDNLITRLNDASTSESERKGIIDGIISTITNLNTAIGEEAYAWDAQSGVLLLHGQQVDSVKQSYDQLIQSMMTQAWLENHKDAYYQAAKVVEDYEVVADTAWTDYENKAKQALAVIGEESVPYTKEQVASMAEQLTLLGQNQAAEDLRRSWSEYGLTMQGLTQDTVAATREMEIYNGVASGQITDLTEATRLIEGKALATEKSSQQIKAEIGWVNEVGNAYRDQYGEFSELNTNRIYEMKEQLSEQQNTDKGIQQSSTETKDKIVENTDLTKNAFDETHGAVLKYLDEINSYTFTPKYIDIYENYHSGGGGLSNYSANGRSSGRYPTQSGGFGAVHLNNVINVNNNGQAITQQSVRSWGRLIADEVNLQLGRRLR